LADYNMETIDTQWGPTLLVLTAPNPGPKTLEGTRTYVLTADECYIIDPGPAAPDYQRFLASMIDRVRDRPSGADGILLTHGHPDHAPGAILLSSLLHMPIYASPELDREFLPAGQVIRPISDGYSFPAGDQHLVALTAPGHSSDHLAFWLEDDRILFAGDTVLGRGTSLVAPPEGDMRLYMETLSRFQALRPRLICPGHGPVIGDPEATLVEYVEHRRKREIQVLTALSDGPASARQLVERLYAEVDPRLHDLAEGSVLAQLKKLEDEGRVRRAGGRYTLA